jgi:hypothetical protein
MTIQSESGVTKSGKVYVFMTEMIDKQVKNLRQIDDYLNFLSNNVNEMKWEYAVKGLGAEFLENIETFRSATQQLEQFRSSLDLEISAFDERLKSNVGLPGKMTLDEREILLNQVNKFVELTIKIMDSLSLIKKSVKPLNDESKKIVDDSERHDRDFGQLMQCVYTNSLELMERIDQYGINFKTNINSGGMQNILMAKALLETDLELAKKPKK